MKIGLVQFISEKGDVSKNIENHLKFIRIAIQQKANVIVFPELSITGFEPTLAKELAVVLDDSRFNAFQDLANAEEVTIGVGMPTKASDGINISMMIFRPHKERMLYSKQILHEDEFPYFVSGKKEAFFTIDGKKIALGICYETMQERHIRHAVSCKADVYLASVAKSKIGVEKAYAHFPKMAKELNIPILMSNSVGPSDNFISAGKSAVWNRKGERLSQLNEDDMGILIYDTELEEVQSFLRGAVI
ncbi:MAG: carbon-nitrogen hydrolase family protein [Bacteroidota bacterium]